MGFGWLAVADKGREPDDSCSLFQRGGWHRHNQRAREPVALPSPRLAPRCSPTGNCLADFRLQSQSNLRRSWHFQPLPDVRVERKGNRSRTYRRQLLILSGAMDILPRLQLAARPAVCESIQS